MEDITDLNTDVFEGKSGFKFESKDDVYQFKLAKRGLRSVATKEDAKNAVYEIKEAIKNAPSSSKDKEVEDSSSTNNPERDPIEMLNDLKDLHDNDVLTDEEFQKKKQELLDEM